MSEPRDVRLKRLKMRSWRRGMREMDMLLGPFSDKRLAEESDKVLDTYEAMLSENDQEIYRWISGQAETPVEYQSLIAKILDCADAV